MNTEHKTKIAFFGTPEIAASFLDALIAAGMTPEVVVTNPDRPVGRKQERTPPPTKIVAERHAIPVLQPEKITPEFISSLTPHTSPLTPHFDIFIVVAYGVILPESLIDLPKHGTINVHFSLLPRWRGATPVEAAILAGDTETGVSLQKMRFKLDSGPIIASLRTTIYDSETTPELRARLGEMGTKLLIETLPHYLAGEITPEEQDESAVTKCGKIQKEDGELKATDDDITRWRKYRAYSGSVGTFFFIEKAGMKTRVKITDARFENNTFIITRVIPEGKRDMAYKDFIATT